MGICASAKYVPWAGRNEVTLAAKTRKKACKTVLSSFRALSASHAGYLDAMKVVGTSLGAVLTEEDKALFDGPAPPPVEQQPPSDYRVPWSISPGALADMTQPESEKNEAVLEQNAEESMKSAHEEPLEVEDVPDSKHVASMPEKVLQTPPPAVPAPPPPGAGAPPMGQSSEVPATSNALIVHSQMASPLMSGPRGAGLSQLGGNLSTLFADAAEAARPLTNMLSVGVAKDYATLPPLPSYVQGVQQYGGAQQWGQQTSHRESLWETLELVVAYERFRSKDIKAMEEAKWDHSKASAKLGKQSTKQVTPEKANKQQKAINQTHQKVQELEGKIQRLGMSIDTTSRAIEAIKSQMLLPALAFMLPGLVHMWVVLADLHKRQYQLAMEVFGNGRLQGKLVAGKDVHLTVKSHQQDWKTLEAALQKWELAFSENMNAQKVVLVNTVDWLLKINPSAMGGPPPLPVQVQYLQAPPPALGPGGQPYPQQQQQIQYPPQGGAPSQPAYGMPQGPQGVQPIITDPDDVASGSQSNALVVAKGPQYPANHAPPPPDVFGRFLGGVPSGGEPLIALCNDWSKALDNLPQTDFKAAVYSFIGWVKQVEEKHALEAKQLKKVEDMQKQVDKAKHTFEASLKKERDLRNTLASPYGDVPMSKSLQQATSSPAPSGGPPSLGMPRDASSADISDTASGPQEGAPNNQLWLPPVQNSPGQGIASPPQEEAFDKAGAKAQAKEQAKEVKAFAMAREVDLNKGVLEGLKNKLRDETKSYETMALEARHTALTGFEQALPGVFQALSIYATNAGQMYGMLQYQHFRG